jgi:hypothetical protein
MVCPTTTKTMRSYLLVKPVFGANGAWSLSIQVPGITVEADYTMIFVFRAAHLNGCDYGEDKSVAIYII